MKDKEAAMAGAGGETHRNESLEELVYEGFRCGLCGSDQRGEKYPASGRCGPIVRCLSCGLLYLYPRQPLDVKRERNPGEELWLPMYLSERAQRQRDFRRCLSEMERLQPEKGRLLEIGSSFGFFVETAASRGWLAKGIDVDPEAVRWARERLQADVSRATLRGAGFPDASFECVVMLNVLEHLFHPEQELGEVARILRKGGLLVLELPDVASLWVRILGKRWRHFHRWHFWHFSPRTISRLLDTTGFQMIELRPSSRSASLGFILDRLWMKGYLPRRLVETVHAVLSPTGLLNRTITIRLGDDMLIFARRI